MAIFRFGKNTGAIIIMKRKMRAVGGAETDNNNDSSNNNNAASNNKKSDDESSQPPPSSSVGVDAGGGGNNSIAASSQQQDISGGIKKMRNTEIVRAIESFGIRALNRDEDFIRFAESFHHCHGHGIMAAMRATLQRPEEAHPAAMQAIRAYAAEHGGGVLNWIADVIVKSIRMRRTPLEMQEGLKITESERPFGASGSQQFNISSHTRHIVIDPFTAQRWVAPPPPSPMQQAAADPPSPHHLPPMQPIAFELQDLDRLGELDLLHGGGSTTLHRYDCAFTCMVALSTMLLCSTFKRKETVEQRAAGLEAFRREKKERIAEAVTQILTEGRDRLIEEEPALRSRLEEVKLGEGPEMRALEARAAELRQTIVKAKERLALFAEPFVPFDKGEDDSRSVEMRIALGNVHSIGLRQLDEFNSELKQCQEALDKVPLPSTISFLFCFQKCGDDGGRGNATGAAGVGPIQGDVRAGEEAPADRRAPSRRQAGFLDRGAVREGDGARPVRDRPLRGCLCAVCDEPAEPRGDPCPPEAPQGHDGAPGRPGGIPHRELFHDPEPLWRHQHRITSAARARTTSSSAAPPLCRHALRTHMYTGSVAACALLLQEEEEEGRCGICWLNEPAPNVEAPCGFGRAVFHHECMARWSARRARCPHCNVDALAGIVVQMVRGWMRDSTETDCWWRGPVFLRVCDGMLFGANETRACESMMRGLLDISWNSPPDLVGAPGWKDGVLSVSFRRNANREILIRIWRNAYLGRGNALLCDGFCMMALQRRAMPSRRRPPQQQEEG